MKLNTTLEMGMRCCRFAGYTGDQIKTMALLREVVSEDLSLRNVKLHIREVIPAGVRQPNEAEMSRGTGHEAAEMGNSRCCCAWQQSDYQARGYAQVHIW
jgi:hypothetical protein